MRGARRKENLWMSWSANPTPVRDLTAKKKATRPKTKPLGRTPWPPSCLCKCVRRMPLLRVGGTPHATAHLLAPTHGRVGPRNHLAPHVSGVSIHPGRIAAAGRGTRPVTGDATRTRTRCGRWPACVGPTGAPRARCGRGGPSPSPSWCRWFFFFFFARSGTEWVPADVSASVPVPDDLHDSIIT